MNDPSQYGGAGEDGVSASLPATSRPRLDLLKRRVQQTPTQDGSNTIPPSTAAHEPRSAHTLPFGQPPASDNLHLPLDTSFDLGESVSAMPRYQPPQLDDEEEEEDHEEEEGGMTMPQAAATAQEEENVLMERDWSSFVYIVPPAPTAGMQGMKTLERISAMLRRKEEELLLERSLQIDVDETTFERKIKIQEQQQREQEIQRNEREQISKDPAAARANAINLILERRNRRGEENVAAQMENSDAVAQAPSARPNIFATLARRLNADSGAPPAAQIDISTTDTPVSPDASAWEPVTSTESGDSYIEPSSVPGFSTAPRPSFSSTDSSVASRNETVHGTTRSSKTLPRLGSVSRTDDGVDASANRARTLPRLHMSSTVMPSADLVDVPSRGSSLATTAAPIPQVDVNAMLQQLQKQQIMQQAQGYNEGENYLNLKYMMLTGQGPSSAPSAAIADWVASVAAANPGSTTSSMAAIDTMLSPTDAGKTTNLPISTPKTPHGLTPTQRSMLAGSPVTFSPRSSSRNLKDGPPSPIQSPLLPRSATQQQASSPLIPARHIQNYNQHHHFIAHPPPSTPIQSANSPVPNQPSTLSSLLHQHSPTNSPPHIHPGSSKTLPHPTSKSILNSALNFINRAPGSNSGFQTLLPSFATRARAPRTTTTAAVLDAARRKQEVEERGRKREKGEIHRRSTSASALESSLGHPARVLRRSSVESIRGWVEKEVGIENDVDMLPTPPPVSASAYSNAPLSITIDSSISHKANPSATSLSNNPPSSIHISTSSSSYSPALQPQDHNALSSKGIIVPQRSTSRAVATVLANSTTPPTLSSPTSSHKRWNSDDVGAWKPDTSPMTLGRIPSTRATPNNDTEPAAKTLGRIPSAMTSAPSSPSQNSAMGWMPPSPKPKSTLAPQPISESRPATGAWSPPMSPITTSPRMAVGTLQTRPTAACKPFELRFDRDGWPLTPPPRADSMEALASIQATRRPQKTAPQRLTPRSTHPATQSKTGNRTFLKHGHAWQVVTTTTVKNRHLFLFSDILIMAKETTDSHYEIKGVLDVKRATIALKEPSSRILNKNLNLNSLIKTTPHPVSIAIRKFSVHPIKAVCYLIAKRVLPCTPQAIAHFLHTTPGLSRRQMGKFLGMPEHHDILEAYLRGFAMAGMRMDAAVRVFLGVFRLPSALMRIDGVMFAVAGRWNECNPGVFGEWGKVVALRLVFAIMALNAEVHGGVGGVSEEGFVDKFFEGVKEDLKNVGGEIDERDEGVRRMLKEIYEGIVGDRLEMIDMNGGEGSVGWTFSMDGEDEEEFPFRLRLREFSPLVTLSLPTAIEHLRVRVHGVDVVSEPDVLDFSTTRSVGFRIKGLAAGRKLVMFSRVGRGVREGGVGGLMTRGVLVEPKFMKFKFQLTVDEGAAGEGLGVIKEMKVAGEVKKRYLFAVGDDGVLGEWVRALEGLVMGAEARGFREDDTEGERKSKERKIKLEGELNPFGTIPRKLGMAASLSSPSENDEDEDDDGENATGQVDSAFEMLRGDIGRAFGLDGSLDASEVGGWTAEKIIEIVLGLP